MMHLFRAWLLVVIFAVGSGAVAQENSVKAGGIAVERAWARATPSGAKVAAGYLTIVNSGPDDRLLSATAEIADRVEIHEMTMENGMMRMRELPDGVTLPKGETVMLAPGATHLMFLGLKRELKEGESFAGTLTFSDGKTVDVTFEVAGLGAAAPKDAQHHHHH